MPTLMKDPFINVGTSWRRPVTTPRGRRRRLGREPHTTPGLPAIPETCPSGEEPPEAKPGEDKHTPALVELAGHPG
jgi:hypothetical protein